MSKNNIVLITLTLPALIAAANAATVVDFSGGTTNSAIAANFASQASANGTGYTVTAGGTPNISLAWGPQNASSNTQRWEYYTDSVWAGGVGQLNNADAGTIYNVTFTPDSGAKVVINSFNFFSYYASATDATTSNGQFEFDWSVVRVSDSAVMTSGNTGLFTGGAASPTINVNFTAADTNAYNLIITRNATTPGLGGSANIAVDNISFSQISAVPEPSTYGLLGGSALAAAALIRRRKRAV